MAFNLEVYIHKSPLKYFDNVSMHLYGGIDTFILYYYSSCHIHVYWKNETKKYFIMPIEKTFTNSDIQELITNNAVGDFKERNTALIIGASYWGLTRIELSQLPLGCLMTETGQWYSTWTLPSNYSFNGESRELYTADHILPVLNAYLDWLSAKNIGLSNLSTYRGHDPDVKFFVNDKFEKFALTKRSKRLANDKVSYQPRSMDDKLKNLLAGTSIQGATPSTFRDSWLRELHTHGCKIKDLMDVSGYKTQSTIVDKIKPKELELEKVFNNVYSRINFDK